MAVLASVRGGPELARDDIAASHQLAQSRPYARLGHSPPRGHVRGNKWNVRPRVAADQRLHRLLAGIEKRFRESDGQADPQRLAVFACILRGDPPRLARHAHRDRAARALELAQPLIADAASGRFGVAEVAEPDQQVVSLVDVTRKALGQQALQLELDLGYRLGVEQLAKVLAAEQLG